VKNILEILNKNAKLKPQDIARMLNQSVENIKKQIKNLEQEGTIVKYKAVINWDKIKTDVVRAVIEVKVQPTRGKGFEETAKRIYGFDEVKSLYLVSGNYDLLVIVEGKNMKEVAFFVAEKLATIENVQSTATHFLLKKYKEDGDILENIEQVKRLPISP
jgi:DNA-binding Lrp family transcriptional regulator